MERRARRGARVGLWALCALVALAAATACDGQRRLEMPPDEAVVPDLSLPPDAVGQLGASSKSEPVRIAMTEPSGVVTRLNAINVVFNQSMVKVEGVQGIDVQGPPPLKITPPLKGSFRWVGSRTLSFVPAEKLPKATRFTVEVSPELRSARGDKVQGERSFTFSTPSPTIVRYDPSWYNARLKPDDQIMIQFNMPIRAEDLQGALKLMRVGDNTIGPVPFTVKATDKDRGKDKVRPATAYVIKPKGGFESNVGYHLRLVERVRPLEGVVAMEPGWNRKFKTYGRFAFEGARCGSKFCAPNTTWSLSFSNPIDPKKMEECISVRPAVKTRVYGYGARLSISPVNAKPNTTYTVGVKATCKDRLGNALGKKAEAKIEVGHYPPMMQMRRGMSFMEKPPNGESIKFPLTLRNTPSVFLRMLKLDEESIAPFVAKYDSWSRTDTFKKSTFSPQIERPFKVRLPKDASKTYGVDLAEALGKSTTGVVYFDVRSPEYTASYSYRTGEPRYLKSLVQVTDLGITAKYSPESVLIWATSLATGEPREGVRVSMRLADNTVMWSGVTDKQGVARGPGLKQFGSKKPRVIIAAKGDDLSFLDLQGWDVELSPYRYNVDYQWNAPAAAVRGFVFTERGVYRPGEAVHIKGYMRLDRGRALEAMPTGRATLTVKDARDNVALSQEVKLSEWGSFDAKLPLKDASALGTYRISVKPLDLPKDAGIKGTPSGSFRVEAYRAPDFEVDVSARTKHVIEGDSFEAVLSGQYLFGAPMNGAKVSWSAMRREASFVPPGWKGFEFGPREGRFWWSYDYQDSALLGDGDGELDRMGRLSQKIEVKAHERIKGPQSVTVEATVQDVNRQTVSGRSQVKIHPGAFYIGLKRPGYLVEAGEPFKVDVATVGFEGAPVPNQQVTVELVKREWLSSRKKTAGGGYTWVTEKKDTVLKTAKVRTRREAVASTLEIGKPGYYIVQAKAKDAKGRQVETSTGVYASGGGYFWWGRDDDERIDLIADKETYKVGDVARIMVKSPFREAQALVTIERRGIIEQQVLPIKGSASTIKVPITEDMMPNAYVSAVLVRGRVEVDAKTKDAAKEKGSGRDVDPGKPAYKAGYVPLTVDTSSKVLDVAVKADREVYAPGETVQATIALRDASGKPVAGEVTFMAVDEGVLSLTAYGTPKPHKTFFRKQPMSVLTAESRRVIVSRVDMASEDGMKGDEGGGGGSGQANNYRSAFATTAAFMPAVKVNDEGTATVSFKLPDNLTAFRLMAVAVASDNRFGSGERRVTVQKPLMVRPALPRFMSAGDTLDVRAVVQAVGQASGEVQVRVDVDGPLELKGGDAQTLTLGVGEAKEAIFPAKVTRPGQVKVRFVAKGAAFKGDDAVEMTIPVKVPAASRSFGESGQVVDQGGGSGVIWKRVVLPEGIRDDFGGLDVELASSAIAELLPGLQYLVEYPYGCVEQTTGRTLPLVALKGMLETFELPGIEQGEVNTFTQAGINRLLSMQTYGGGLGYWPGASEPHPWGSVYGGLALVQASKTPGLNVPERKLKRLKEYLRSVLHGEAAAPDYWDKQAWATVRPFAAYVLAVAEAPDHAYHEVLYNARNTLPNFGKGLLAMAILESGGDQEMVRTLIDQMLTDMTDNGAEAFLNHESTSHGWMTMDSDVRANAIALMVMQRARAQDVLTGRFARGLLKARKGGRWISTQENAFAVLSLGNYFRSVEGAPPRYDAVVGLGDKVKAEVRFEGRGLKTHHVHIPMQELVKAKGDILSIVREGEGGPLYYTARLRYAPQNPPRKSRDEGFTLMREYLAVDGPNKGKPVTEVKPGQVVKVRLTLVAPHTRHYVAIEDPLPSGLEPINTAFATTASTFRAEVRENNSDPWDWWYEGMRFDHTEQRDDRILLFADVLQGGVYNHAYLARATSTGVFTVPAARVEEMYHPDTYGLTDAFELTVR